MGKDGAAGRSATGRVAAAFLLLALSATCAAQQRATVVMAGDRAYPPYQFLDSRDRADGFDVALFRAVAEEAGFAAELRLGDWERSLAALEAGEVDVVPMFVTPERSRRFLFSRPFLQRHHLVFARQGSRYIASLDELRGARVAVQNAGLAADALDAVGGAELLRTATEAEAITAVASGVAGFALVPTTIGYLAVLESGTDEVVAVSQPLLSLPYAFAVASDRPDLVRGLDAALAGVQADGTSDRLWLAWLANLQPTRRDGQLWLAPAVASIGRVSCLALWWRRRSARASPAAQAGDLQLVHELRAALAADAVG